MAFTLAGQVYVCMRYMEFNLVNNKETSEAYYCFIRPVLEYAVPIWASLPSHLSAEIESIQQRALKIIFRSG